MKHEASHIHDNRYLCAWDMTHAEPSQKIAWLTQIIDNELDRGEEMDEQLILECAEHLEQLTANKKPSPPFIPKQTTPHRFLRRFAAIASVFALVVLFSPRLYVQAMAERDNKLYHKAADLDFLSIEATQNDQLINQSPTSAYEATYSDLSSFFRDHSHLNFHYPSNLPADQAIRSIGIIYHSEKSWIIVFSFQDPSVKSFIVQQLSQPSRTVEEPQAEKYFSTGTQNYAISEKTENGKTVFVAECYTDGLWYTVEAYDFNTLRLILSKAQTQAYHSFADIDEFLTTHPYLQEFFYPKQLPDEFRSNSVYLVYRSSADWTLTLRYVQPQTSNQGTVLKVSPIDRSTPFDFGTDPPILANETVSLYLISSGSDEEHGHYEAVGIVDNMKYTLRAYGYNAFVALAESIFGDLS